MFIMDSFANVKQPFPSQYLETPISEVAEESAPLCRRSPTDGFLYGAAFFLL